MTGSNPGPQPDADRRVPVWDIVVRFTHGAVATLVIVDWIRDDGDWWHRQLGYVAAGLVVARLVWAALRAGHSSLRALKPSAAATFRYVREGTPRTTGHDPLGVWMIWCLWLLILSLALTGWMSRLDAFWGDDRVHAVHGWLADTLMVCVAIHLLGIAVMSWRWRENLPAAMVSGKKKARSANR
jgi:cytochrome b